jgi:dephospho-CoA kinase
MKKPVWIGLTGGTSSGKSTVSALLKDQGISVFNLDTIGRDLMEKDARVIARLREICGDAVIDSGQLNRKRIREILFSNAEKKREIEAFLHPLIWAKFLELSAEAAQKGAKCIVCESALILESSLDRQMQELIVVLASEEIRKARLVERDGISPLLATQMIQSQTDDAIRKAHASFIIENNGTLEELQQKVTALIKEWKRRDWV